MINRIVKHEWRALCADRTVWILSALLLVLVSYGVWNGASWTRFRADTVQRAQLEESQKMGEMQNLARQIEAGAPTPKQHAPTDATAVALFDGTRYALLPPAPLSVLAVGQSDLYPSHFKITAQSKSTWSNSEEIENPVNLLAGRFDMAFVVVFLMPICILAVSYNLLSGERENGTLAMLLSQGVPLSKLVWGKIAARFFLVTGLVLSFSLLALFLGGVTAQSGAQIVQWALLVSLYSAFWFALAGLVNVWGKNSASNAMTLLACWLGLVLLVPSLVGVAASEMYPVPSRLELIQASRQAAADAASQRDGIMARYYEDHPELAPKTRQTGAPNAYLRFYATQELVARCTDPLLARYDEQLAKQQNVVNRFRFLSPAIVTQEAINDLAGTGSARYRKFSQQANEFHDDYRDYFRPKAFAEIKLTSSDYDAMPRFEWREETAGEIGGRVLPAIVALLGGTLALSALVFAFARRNFING